MLKEVRKTMWLEHCEETGENDGLWREEKEVGKGDGRRKPG